MSKITRVTIPAKTPSAGPRSSPKTPPATIPRTPQPRIVPVIKPRAMVAVAKGPSLGDVPTKFGVGVKVSPTKPKPGTAY